MQKISKFIKEHILLLSVIYSVGLFSLNVLRLFDGNFWYDEAFSLGLAEKSFSGMIVGTALDVHPPFYYVILWIACRIFGFTPFVFRAVSIVPLAAVIVLSLTWVRKRFSTHAALIVITFANILETAMIFNVQARMYSWGEILMLLSFIAFYEILRNDKTAYYVLFSVSTLCGAYTHYYILIAVAFLYLTLLILAFKKKLSLKKVLITCAAAVVIYMPWLIVLLGTFGRTSGDYWITRIAHPVESLAFIYTDAGEGNPFGYILAAVLFPLTIAFMLKKFNILIFEKKENGKPGFYFSLKNKKYSTLGVWFFGGLAAIMGTAVTGSLVSILVRPMYITRYIFPMAVIAWLMAGVCISLLKERTLITSILIIVVLAVNLPIYAVRITQERAEHKIFEDTHTKTADIIGEGDIIFSEISHLALKVDGVYEGINTYYYPGSVSVRALPDDETDMEERKFSNILDTYGKPEGDTEYYLFLADDMSSRYSDILTAKGYSWEVICLDGNIGTYPANIYRLTPAN